MGRLKEIASKFTARLDAEHSRNRMTNFEPEVADEVMEVSE